MIIVVLSSSLWSIFIRLQPKYASKRFNNLCLVAPSIRWWMFECGFRGCSIQVHILCTHPPLPIQFLRHYQIGKPSAIVNFSDELGNHQLAISYRTARDLSYPIFLFLYAMDFASLHMANLWQLKSRSILNMSITDHANKLACCRIICWMRRQSSPKSWFPN